jgi:phenylacetate-CoA ligase
MPKALQQQVVGRKLSGLLQHAVTHSPFWRERLNGLLRQGAKLHELPILTRQDIQKNFEAMRARTKQIKPAEIVVARTSGSTGQPVAIERHEPTYRVIYTALNMRDYFWQKRDATKSAAVIKDLPDQELSSWGPHFHHLGIIGKAWVANLIQHSPEYLAQWLRDKQPEYLVTTPAMAKRVAELALADASLRTPIREIMTYGEVVTAELRHVARAAYGAQVTDRYSCEECGWIAMQCSKHEHLHVPSAVVQVEIVDEAGKPCPKGTPGRVLITSLYSHVMPLIRYEIGDIAEMGAGCDCGSNLPVISRILGRERSFIQLPDGSLRLARLTGEHWRQHAPIREYRVVQYTDGIVEAIIVPERPLSAQETANLKSMLAETLGHPFPIVITETAAIHWQSRWKRHDVMRLNRDYGGRSENTPLPSPAPAAEVTEIGEVV